MRLRLFLLFLTLSFLSYAQTKVSGTVKDSHGEPTYGVVVKIKGTSKAVETNIDGKYTIEVSNGDVLVFSLNDGSAPIERTFTGQTTMDVSLDKTEQLNAVELVETGYGKVSKAGYSGSATVVGSENVTRTPSPSFESALAGNATGVNMSMSSGQPGGSVNVNIRGVGSLNANAQPLYVIDGVPVNVENQSGSSMGVPANPMASINPNDIESMTVLKDASAASIYGARGANGVIVITTKQGKSGQAKIDFSAEAGVSTIPWGRGYNTVSSREYYDLYFNAYYDNQIANGKIPDLAVKEANSLSNGMTFSPWNISNPYIVNSNGQVELDPNAKMMVDNSWKDALFRNAIYQKYSLSASGGSDKVTYYASVAYNSQEGVGIGSDFERLSNKINLSAKILDNLKFGMNNTLSYTNTNAPLADGNYASPMNTAFSAPNTNRIYEIDEVEKSNGNLVYVLDAFGNKIPDQVNFVQQGQNPIAVIEKDIFNSKSYRAISDMFLDLEIFREEDIGTLSLRPSIAIDLTTTDNTNYRNPFNGDASAVKGRMTKEENINILWRNLNALNYSNKIDKHNISFLLASELVSNTFNTVSAQGIQFPVIEGENFPHLIHASSPIFVRSQVNAWKLASFIGKMDYNFDNRYYFAGSYRRDGSSRFGAKAKWGNFWSLGVTWNIKKESFLEDIEEIDVLKLRTSYGTLGNDRIGNFASLSSYTSAGYYNNINGYRMVTPLNENLTWEKTSTFNIGIDFTIFKTISGSIEFYNKSTSDMLFDVPLSRVNGIPTATVNGGSMRNRGIEIEIRPIIIQSLEKGEFNWDMNFNIAFNQNRLLSLPEQYKGDEYISGAFVNKIGESARTFSRVEWAGVAKAGQTIYNRTFVGKTASGGEPLWYIYDSDGTKYTSYEYVLGTNRRASGSAIPTVTGGLGNTFTYQGFSLAVLFSYQFGGVVYDAVYAGLMHDGNGARNNVAKEALNHYGNDENSKNPLFQPSDILGRINMKSNDVSTRFQYSSDFIRLRNISLGYTLPSEYSKALKLRSLSINVNLENSWAWFLDSNFKGYDTQVDSNTATAETYGYVNYRIPSPTTFSVGINVGL